MIPFGAAQRKSDLIRRKFKQAQQLADRQIQEQKLEERELKVYELMRMVCVLAMDRADRLERELNELGDKHGR